MKPNLRFVRGYILLLVVGVALNQKCLAQTPDSASDARKLLQSSEEEQLAFVLSVIDRGFQPADGDKFALLLVNRSGLVVPQLESRIENDFRSSHPSDRFIDLASAMIAYAGDEESLRAVGKLLILDEKRFDGLVERTLDSALDWRNPFTVAYAGLRLGDEAISRRIVGWSEKAMSSDSMRRLWAGALVERYKRVPSSAELENDPIATRMSPLSEGRWKESVLRYAREEEAKRER
jgi:hypothetical protein